LSFYLVIGRKQTKIDIFAVVFGNSAPGHIRIGVARTLQDEDGKGLFC